MSYKVNLLAAAIVAGIVAMPMAFAASPSEVFVQCKKEAETEEVDAKDVQNYIRGCMKENGVESADIDGVLQGSSPKGENSDG